MQLEPLKALQVRDYVTIPFRCLLFGASLNDLEERMAVVCLDGIPARRHDTRLRVAHCTHRTASVSHGLGHLQSSTRSVDCSTDTTEQPTADNPCMCMCCTRTVCMNAHCVACMLTICVRVHANVHKCACARVRLHVRAVRVNGPSQCACG